MHTPVNVCSNYVVVEDADEYLGMVEDMKGKMKERQCNVRVGGISVIPHVARY